jgi:hypothetical protein
MSRKSRLCLLSLEDRVVPANNTVPGTVTFPNPTINNISVVWPITGDDNLNATVAVRFRQLGDSAWTQGMNLIRIPAGTNTDVGRSWINKLAGSVFDVKAATTYEVELMLVDPDGGSTTRTGTVSTRAVPAPMAGAPVVNATPSTLGSILNNASPGDIIELGAGTYGPFTVPHDGLAGQPIVIRDSDGNAVLNGPGGAGNAIDLTGRSHVIVDGLTINNGRVKLNGAFDVAVVRCTIHASADGILALTRAEDLYIADNRLFGQGKWIESDLGASGFDGGEGIQVIGPGHVVEHNFVEGFRDNISLLEGAPNSDQWSIDILNNDLRIATDDAIEADYAEGNVRVMRNRITNCFMGISSQPSLGGPSYFIRNVIYNVILHAFKLHRGSVGDIGLHNTIVKNGDAFSVYSGVPHTRGYFRNNLFIGGPGGTYNGFDNGPGKVIELPYADATDSFDYDAYGSTAGTFSGHIGATAFNSLAQLQANTTEQHALQIALGVFNTSVAYPSNPLASAPPAPDLRLAAGSTPENAALAIPNVNLGAGADIGAYEIGSALPPYGPRVANAPPVANDDSASTLHDTPVDINVKSNDTDADNDLLTVIGVTQGANGSVTINANNTVRYTPNAGFFGSDSFTYTVDDGRGETDSATVSVTVIPPNRPPVANDDAATTGGLGVRIPVLANDTDPDGDLLTVQSFTTPAKGSVSRSGQSLLYTPRPGTTGADSFNYTVSDGHGHTDIATVSITITDTVAPRLAGVRLFYGSTRYANLASLGRAILPWENITRIEVAFNEAVTVGAGDLTLAGIGGNYGLTFAGFDPVRRTAAWTLAAPLGADRLTLRLAGSVADAAGNPLGSDWARTFGLLPGDFDGNGLVDNRDVAGVRAWLGRPNAFADIDGDGRVTQADITRVLAYRGRRLP